MRAPIERAIEAVYKAIKAGTIVPSRKTRSARMVMAGVIIGFCCLCIASSYILSWFGMDPVEGISSQMVSVILGTFIAWALSVGIDHATANITGRIVKERPPEEADASEEAEG
jgi:TRAP-type C4-dicarboxylate transport system permease small subunit